MDNLGAEIGDGPNGSLERNREDDVEFLLFSELGQ